MQWPVPADYAGYLHVVAAAILDGDGNVFIARRPAHLHQGGLWEFPGGKIEAGESVQSALARELGEEIGITDIRATPLIRIPYCYPDRKVLLDVWRVADFAGTPHGREGQEACWVPVAELRGYQFPAANRPIIAALTLPDRYLITPEPGGIAERAQFLECLGDSLAAGIQLVQLRAKTVEISELIILAQQVQSVCRQYGAKLLLNAPAEVVLAVGADGIHLSSSELYRHKRRPLPATLLIGASCHTLADLAQAAAIDSDFAVLSPVSSTKSHPGSIPLGWDGFAALVAKSRLPVYALGGMGNADIATAIDSGGQGIAAITALWCPQSGTIALS